MYIVIDRSYGSIMQLRDRVVGVYSIGEGPGRVKSVSFDLELSMRKTRVILVVKFE